MKFVVHTTETASPASREGLETAEKLFGFVPNLLGVLAAAPIALEAYIILTKLTSSSAAFSAWSENQRDLRQSGTR